MICPRCGASQPDGAECVRCGVVVAKYAARAAQQPPSPAQPPTPIQPRSPDQGPQVVPPAVSPAPAAVPLPRPASGPWLSAQQRGVLFADLQRLLRANVPLPEALALASAAVGPSAARAGAQLAQALQQGAALPEELRRYLGLFDPVDQALLVAAIETGTLPAMCARLAARHQHAAQAAHKLRAGLTYPLLLIGSSALLTPLPLAFSAGVGAFFGAAALNVAALGALALGARALVQRMRRGESQQRVWALAAQIPLVRRLVFARRWALFLDVLALTLQAGLPLPQALELAGAATGEAAGVQLAAQTIQRLMALPLSQAIAGAPGQPPRLVGALASAERSGFLADACTELASESQQRYLDLLATAVAVARSLALAAVALWIAWSLVQQLTGLIADPLGALPGPEGEELRRELQRALPSLRR